MEKKIKELKLEFEEFKKSINDSLYSVKCLINKAELDFSFDEIDAVHLLYEHNFENPEKINLSLEKLKNYFCAYMGEAFIHHFGGNWDLSILKNDEAYGTPIIINWGPKDYPWSRISPYVWTEIIKKGDMDEPMSLIFKRNINRFKS